MAQGGPVLWGRERLFFWRLSFWPTHDRELVLAALDVVLESHHICSFAVYELFGDNDLLVRAWLPVQTTQEDFEAGLRTGLPKLSQLAVFSVTSNVTHWVWESDGEFRRPSQARMLARPPDDEIATVNRFDEAPDELLRRFGEDNLIAEATHTRGIKFVVVVTIAPVGGYVDHSTEMRDRLVGILERAGSVEERSLYEGVGFGRFLVLGRVDFDKFERIRTEVTDPITSELSPSTFGGRTYTMLVPAGDFLRFEERLPVEHPSPRVLTAAEALETVEGRAVEVKAAAFHQAEAWVRTGSRYANRIGTGTSSSTATNTAFSSGSAAAAVCSRGPTWMRIDARGHVSSIAKADSATFDDNSGITRAFYATLAGNDRAGRANDDHRLRRRSRIHPGDRSPVRSRHRPRDRRQ